MRTPTPQFLGVGATILIGLALAYFSTLSPQKIPPIDHRPQWGSGGFATAKWTRFDWAPLAGFSRKAAIFIPVELDGREYTFQLDTGAYFSYLYDDARRQLGLGASSASVTVPAIGLGSMKGRDAAFNIRPGISENWTQGRRKVGTIGLGMLMGGILVIDYPNQRFSLASDLPEGLDTRLSWIPASIRHGWFFTTLKINGETHRDFFFDTGSSVFPLNVDRKLWQTLTGRVGDRDFTDNLLTPSWSDLQHRLGAPAKGNLEIGPVQMSHPMVYYSQEHPNGFRAEPGTAGLFGNAPFFSRVVALDLRDRPRFGIAR